MTEKEICNIIKEYELHSDQAFTLGSKIVAYYVPIVKTLINTDLIEEAVQVKNGLPRHCLARQIINQLIKEYSLERRDSWID